MFFHNIFFPQTFFFIHAYDLKILCNISYFFHFSFIRRVIINVYKLSTLKSTSRYKNGFVFIYFGYLFFLLRNDLLLFVGFYLFILITISIRWDLKFGLCFILLYVLFWFVFGFRFIFCLAVNLCLI